MLIGTALFILLCIFCLFYGLLYSYFAPSLIVAFVLPILLVLMVSLWALPEQRNPPLFAIEALFPLFFIVMLLWPNYVALSLPSLPWITLQRLVSYPMTLLFLYNISVSSNFRTMVHSGVSAIPMLWPLLIGQTLVSIFTLPLSPSTLVSFQVVLSQIISWLVIFTISATIFRNTNLVEKYFSMLCGIAIALICVELYEDHLRYIPWANHIPDLLKVDAPSVRVTLTPSYRAYSDIYRAKGIFSTPLELAEYLSLLTPAFLYFAFTSERWLPRAAALAMIPVLFVAVRMTDSRLGVVGMLVSLLLYGTLWTINRWRSRPGDLLAAAAVYGYPVLFVAATGAVFASHRLNQMVFGGEIQASSTAARKDQLGMAMASLAKAPWGHGAGQSGPAMGYSEGQFVTVDNYFITLALDYGVLGVLFWYGVFIIAILFAFWYSISARYSDRKESRLLAPLAVTLVAFLIIKWVHGQDENHAVYFMMLGMISALILKLRTSSRHPASALSVR